ncbi:BQ2448_1757 [Microbotryum intermedium]|uniref:BQ2448_1757 protein n=1 Tax=Microbotryum intermedium TaxID=269621 RepID=A0A238FEC6_9BASI|nr:BQ2448_1757 [Microbotryum intermedium]
MDAELAVLLFGITLAVEVVGWVGADSIAAFVSAPVPLTAHSGVQRCLPTPPHLIPFPIPILHARRIRILTHALDTTLSQLYAPISRFSSNPTLQSQKALRADIIKLRTELAATSSVDEFSKWAKLRRRVDKAVSELEILNATSSQSRQSFQSIFKRILWVLTTILPFVITSWHRKAAVFYLPPSWFGPATWWLGLPSAPTGAVACGVWTMACKRTIGACKDAVVDLTQKEAAAAQPVPVAVRAQPVSSEKAESKEEKSDKGKKEL